MIGAATNINRFEMRSASQNLSRKRTELRRERIVNRVDEIIDDRGSDLSQEDVTQNLDQIIDK